MKLVSQLFLIACISTVAVAAAPQDGSRLSCGTKTNPPPGGSTPEPTSMLLLFGGAVGYGACTWKSRKNAAAK